MPDDLTGDEIDQETDDQDSQLVRDLRKQIKERSKAATTLEEELKALRAEKRESVLSKAFEAKGISPKAAKLYPADAEATEEAVSAWLSDFGEVLGVQKAADESSTVDESTAEQMRAVARVTATAPEAPGSTIEDFQARLNKLDPKDPAFLDRLEELYTSAG